MSLRLWTMKKWRKFQQWRDTNAFIVAEFEHHQPQLTCPKCGTSMYCYFPGKVPDLRELISSCNKWKCGFRMRAIWDEDNKRWGEWVPINLWGNEIQKDIK